MSKFFGRSFWISFLTFGILFVGVALLTGCATPPTAAEVNDQRNYGPYPQDYDHLVREHLAAVLVDPESVRYREITPPRTAFWGDRVNGAEFGWMVCVTYNARNRLGGYVGNSVDAIMIRDGRVVEHVQGDINGALWWGRQICPGVRGV